MKKFIIMISLCIVLAIAFVACNDGNFDTHETNKEESSSETVTDAPTTEADITDAETEAPTSEADTTDTEAVTTYHYRDNMYTTKVDEEDFAIKPMNCPGSILVYKNEPHSYKDLPIRMGELGLVHRHEKSGQLHGLFRVRCFTQDDAHIFMMPEQIKDEIKGVVRLINEVYTLFGFKYHVELSTRPENSMPKYDFKSAIANS